MLKQRGFSLIELLIVIAIIGIIVTIAIPILLSARRNSCDAKARQSIRNVISAEAAYYASTGHFDTLNALAGTNPAYLDSRFASGAGVLGQNIVVTLQLSGGQQDYTALATNPSGNHDYSTDQSGLITEQ